jgi:hypothetical protein
MRKISHLLFVFKNLTRPLTRGGSDLFDNFKLDELSRDFAFFLC